jgi:antitoxin (DNA-binding transcriptional repressor) of toxin-antitoxin stability system
MGEASAAAVRVANDELATVREAMRELNRLVDALERGELDKVVLTQRNRMRAVLVSFERFAELERHASAEAPPPIRLRAAGGGS